MSGTVANILHRSLRKEGEPLNILCFPTHERHEIGLAKTGHNFYSYQPVPNTSAAGIKTWNINYGEIPENYQILDASLGMGQIPPYVDFDLILSQQKFGQFQTAYPISRQMNIPLLSLEITAPMTMWNHDTIGKLKRMRGDINVFLTNYSVAQWGWEAGNDNRVIKHGIDTKMFKPISGVVKHNEILSVVNDFINRDGPCGFNLWKRLTEGLSTRVVGDTPGLSEPASSIPALVTEYQQAKIFLNTSLESPLPTTLLESMSCGCAIVTTATCEIPNVIKDGTNGFISNDENYLREKLELLLSDDSLCKKMGQEARKTINEQFKEKDFIDNWKKAFYDTSNCIIRTV